MQVNFLSAIGYLVGVAGAITIIFSRVKTENLSDLKDRVELLEREREEARKQHIENQKAISNLEGQLATYKEIPLKSIAKSLEELAKSNKETSESNTLILNALRKSAIIAEDASHDGGLLVKTKKTNPLAVEVKEN